MTNLYLGKSVPSHAFLGRNDEMQDIVDAIYASGNAELIGPHRSGKSALCRKLSEDLQKIDDGVVSIIVDLQHLSTPRFRQAIVSITGVPLVCDSTLPEEHTGADIEAIDTLINHVKSQKKMLVIFIDEMDVGALHKGCFNEWNSNLRTLRHKLFEESCPEIAVVRVFSSNPERYGTIHDVNAVSIMIGTDPIITIKPLLNEQASSLFNSINKNNDVNDQFALKYTGTFPLLIEIFAFQANKIKNKQVDYIDLLHSVYEQSQSFYSDLYRYIESIDYHSSSYISIILSLAFEDAITISEQPKPTGYQKFDLDGYQISQLIKLGVIRNIDGKNVLFSPLFSWWLSRRTVIELTEEASQIKKVGEFLGVKNPKELLGLVKTSISTGKGIAALL
ncbi:hypothetical protein BM524_08680 [Alteromonas mediterranea]|uniref:ORC1/DEAH AAA+ ATPase domain-containing protein n=1 Tax=Alteromonas mediterranea TaxID=314275 RepID=A0AAC9JC95_9ALTE|nr:ATP-binding protein [Alteromonas mediterranea]APD89855.1 hypothetical protein BM524_08680 [Alteromonas mediterranea]